MLLLLLPLCVCKAKKEASMSIIFHCSPSLQQQKKEPREKEKKPVTVDDILDDSSPLLHLFGFFHGDINGHFLLFSGTREKENGPFV